MNEQIRELVKQAGGHFTKHNLMSNPIQHRESIELWDKNIEKFAELIVRECVAQCEINSDHFYLGLGSKISAFNIKQHFGIKE